MSLQTWLVLHMNYVDLRILRCIPLQCVSLRLESCRRPNCTRTGLGVLLIVLLVGVFPKMVRAVGCIDCAGDAIWTSPLLGTMAFNRNAAGYRVFLVSYMARALRVSPSFLVSRDCVHCSQTVAAGRGVKMFVGDLQCNSLRARSWKFSCMS